MVELEIRVASVPDSFGLKASGWIQFAGAVRRLMLGSIGDRSDVTGDDNAGRSNYCGVQPSLWGRTI